MSGIQIAIVVFFIVVAVGGLACACFFFGKAAGYEEAWKALRDDPFDPR